MGTYSEDGAPVFKAENLMGNPFWAKGYGVDTAGVDAEMMHKDIKYQEENEKQLK